MTFLFNEKNPSAESGDSELGLSTTNKFQFQVQMSFESHTTIFEWDLEGLI